MSPSLELTFTHQWQFLSGKCSWYDFSWVHIETEYDPTFGNLELKVLLLGLGFRLVYHYKDTEAGKRIAEKIAELDAMQDRADEITHDLRSL